MMSWVRLGTAVVARTRVRRYVVKTFSRGISERAVERSGAGRSGFREQDRGGSVLMRHTARRVALGWCGRLGRAAGIAGLAVAMTGPVAAASTAAPSAGSSYQELYRPQFHYTPAKN